MDDRVLALLGESIHCHEITKKLKNKHKWKIFRLQETPDTPINVKMQVPIGLVFIDRGTVLNKSRLMQLRYTLYSSEVLWLALLDSEDITTDPIISSMLDRLCHYHQILPCSANRVHTLLSKIQEIYACQQPDESNVLEDSTSLKMVGTYKTIDELSDRVSRFSNIDAPVLINGESGTGKELTAHAIHQASTRANAPFVVVNCGALPESLIQSELYGYEKGAFTGAYQQRKGHIETASGGTLFLDEIGDFPLPLQVNLLRFLESGRIMRVGGRKELHVDVRVVAATNVDLLKAVEKGVFREDLYHRLNVLEINLPPLRERKEDIEMLAHFFYHKFQNESSCRLKGISQEALDVMQFHEWPGNIRELMNRIHRGMLHSESPLLTPADLGLDQRHHERHITSLEQVRNHAEYQALRDSLVNHSNDLSRVANELNISRVTLYRLLEKHKFRPF